MPIFDNEFVDVDVFKYKDWELIRLDRIPVQRKFSGSLKIISTNSEWKQAVCLRVLDKSKDGKLKMDFDSEEAKGFFLWEHLFYDRKDEPILFKGTTKKMELIVYNAWGTTDWIGNKRTDCWTGGAAMIVEINGNTRKYRCNDGHPDDNFDDIIFEVTIDE
ncbi:MAG: hypothetical protein LBC87_00560 [Fibromonadaceae bacterium]|nr:hypothetical protein [Fibromonadaceae bacterium]